MGTFFDDASLVMIPSGVKESKLYSIKPTDGTGDFTFTRGTDTATRVNSAGLIEKETQNLLLQSNTFDTTWTNTNTTETSGQSGYDGTNDAWLLEATATTSTARLQQGVSLTGVHTTSIYAKAGTTDWIAIQMWSNHFAYFDVANGVVGGSGSAIDTSIEAVGNGFYRCSITYNASSVGNLWVYVIDGNGSTSVTSGKNVYLQDAQLEQSLVARTYIETTTAAVYAGITDNLPRLDYSGGASCPSLLLEPQRTNLVTQSEYTGGYSGFNSTQDFNAAISPEKVQNAVKIIATTHNTQHNRFTAFSASGSYSFSVFAKAGEYEFAQLYGGGNQGSRFSVVVNLSDGSIDTYDNITTSQIDVQDYGDGWYRIVVNGFNNTHTFIAIAPIKESGLSRDANYDIDYAGDGTSGVYFYGLQVEAGSYATSYIPTMGVSATRASDKPISSSYNYQSQGILGANVGTIILDCETIGTSTGSNDFHMFGAANNIQNGYLFRANSGTTIDILERNSNATSAQWSSVGNKQTRNKIGVSYNGADADVYVNGVVKSVSSGTPVGGGNINGFATSQSNSSGLIIHQILLFPSKLTDSELASLTTL